ncbi:DNA polymerase [uncultured Cloacibacillus sp.]|uniref:DNA polymerase n=1 Tax=uncultured Cloacibacillus sp. TaxID=889794 RepID=UPI002622D3B7|nr:DNA polymerase [uncultured Cloacibacillus sp.]
MAGIDKGGCGAPHLHRNTAREAQIPAGYSIEDWSKKSFAERCALNTPIQGTAADILKLAMARILSGLPERQWLKPVLQIHDELAFVIPMDKLKEAVNFIRKCMEEKPFPAFDLPLIAEASVGKSFGSMEEI